MKESVLTCGYLYPDKFDKYLVSSDYEFNLLKKYGWSDNQMIKLGLPRWDLLQKNKSEKYKSILIMFTWRRIPSLYFDNSLYKKRILHLLEEIKNNKTFSNNIKIYFTIHHALKRNSKINFNINNSNVKIIDISSVSEYISECSCLITDFSSVAFDFMFLNKPVIHYLMDKYEYNADKYDREDIARFDYKKFIIPNVFYTENDVLMKLKYYINNNFELEKNVQKKYEKFFYTKENIREKLTKEIEKL